MYERYRDTLDSLEATGNLRRLPDILHDGGMIMSEGKSMLNLSSNDYLAIAEDRSLREEFLETTDLRDIPFSSSSSRSLTGNFREYSILENELCRISGAESALVFTSGYSMNSGILPAVTGQHDLILADKLVHASIIDGIRLSAAKCIRFRHQDYSQLERLLASESGRYDNVIIAVESIYSMDGDVADLRRLVSLKDSFPNVMLYVDEAHAVGVRGESGFGIAEETGCTGGIDFLCGTFGKALGSVGAYVLCSSTIRNYLINRMRTFIFTTALPPVNLLWSSFIVRKLPDMADRRRHLEEVSATVRKVIRDSGAVCPSESHIIPYVIGDSREAVMKASQMQAAGFYLLPVRPPTVPEGTSRLRISMNSSITGRQAEELALCLTGGKGKL